MQERFLVLQEAVVLSSITINSNIASLNAQRRLGTSSRSLQDSFTRLSSGLRINKASDDAAGLAIAESLDVDTSIYNQGVRNLNDGISLLSIGDAALNELSSITIRLTELAEQSANGALSNTQRKALDAEAQALRDEYFRISQTTEFNGVKLFDGQFGTLRLQAGYGTDGGIVSGLGGAIGDGTFQAATSFETEGIAFETVVADFNSDGILDIAATDNSDSSISVLIGNGDGSFQGRTTFAAGAGLGGIESADFNNDGIVDLIATSFDDDLVNVYLGNGDGSFSNASVTVGDRPFAVIVDDFNNDGYDDFATAEFNSYFNVFLGSASGTFTQVQTVTTGTRPRDIVSGDLNGDSIADIVTADYNGDTISVAYGVGDGTFNASVSYAAGNDPLGVALADVNKDGFVDIVSAEAQSATVSVLFGSQSGTFGGLQSYASGAGSKSLRLADLNGDGNLDAIAGARDDDAASVLLGNADGSFGAFTNFVAGDVNNVVAADFNGDGVYDLLTSDRNRQTVSILLANTESGVAPLLDFSLSSMAGARQALPILKEKLAQLAAQRGELGAFEARISTALATTQVASENFSSAQSQIRDADVAYEAAALVRNQILQQSGAAILAQANQGPALALQLLQ